MSVNHSFCRERGTEADRTVVLLLKCSIVEVQRFIGCLFLDLTAFPAILMHLLSVWYVRFL